ncbi:MAG: hydantoinase/oxoprolinase family protein [Rhodospirillaceae bacterium]|nr:hydantoinase/oxoprolinase family protein [Rhodospirillaceae bacterium]
MTAARARIGVDIGGTFTDVVLEQGATRHSIKVLTTPGEPERAVLDGVLAVTRAAGTAPGAVELIIHGTTLITNALIERKGARTALVTTAGFRDVLDMGTESRFEQYDLAIEKPAPLVPRRLRFAVPERLGVKGDVLLPLDEAALDAVGAALAAAAAESVAICFLHAYANPAHEQRARERLQQALPKASFSLSSEVAPEIREYERFSTTAANAYVQPIAERYLFDLQRKLAAAGFGCPLFLMLSGGGVTDLDTAARFPIRLIESGPAGGVALAAHIARQCGLDRVVSFDMGGTTAKIAIVDDGVPQTARAFEFGRVFRFKKGSGLPLKVPSVELVEIGAGGGSIASIDHLGCLAVGPESAGSEPGPASYGRGGTAPTVTDADLALGRIRPAAFAGGRIALDAAAAERALGGVGRILGLAPPDAAAGIAEVVDEAMANAAREHVVECGKSLPGRTLIAFGGAAPLHAARIAEKLEIDRVLIPSGAGVGSAIGFLRAPVAYEVTRSVYVRLAQFDPATLNRAFSAMAEDAHAVVARAAAGAARSERRIAYMRYLGQGHEIAVAVDTAPLGRDSAAALRDAYDEAYRAQYGRLIDGVDVECVACAVIVSSAPPETASAPDADRAAAAQPAARRTVIEPATGRRVEVSLYRREALAPGAIVPGPALIEEDDTTTVVASGFDATIEPQGYILLQRRASETAP